MNNKKEKLEKEHTKLGLYLVKRYGCLEFAPDICGVCEKVDKFLRGMENFTGFNLRLK